MAKLKRGKLLLIKVTLMIINFSRELELCHYELTRPNYFGWVDKFCTNVRYADAL